MTYWRLTRFALAATLLASALAIASPPLAQAQQPKEVKVAVIVPLSGPWARQGQLIQMGAAMAVDEINAQGGIKALGGAKMVLISADAGDTTEKAKNAAQRLLSQEPDLVGGSGSWLSSFTLAVTEVTERAQLPWLTLSYSDLITERGFKYVFQTSATGGAQARGTMPAIIELAKEATGKSPTTVGMISDNTASPVSITKPLREGLLQQLGLKTLFDEIYTPPLADATPLIQRVRSNRPEMLLFINSASADTKQVLEKLKEFRLGQGAVPTIGNGAQNGSPEVAKIIPKDVIEGFMFSVAHWSVKGQEEMIERFTKRTGEPWLTQDSIGGYGDMWVLKEAMESAGSADRVKVAEAIRKLNLQQGPAAIAYAGGVKFDEKGRRENAQILVVQWQNGVPVTVFPTKYANAKPIWPKN